VALFAGAELVGGEYAMLGRGHAEALVPMIARLPAKGRAARILVGLGPGSFTGVRIGLAAARALALAWGAEVCGYPTLALIAAMARMQAGGATGEPAGAQPVLVATTGGHGEWFVQGFDASGAAAGPLASLTPEAAARRAGALVAGSQAEALVGRRGSGVALPLWPDARAAMALPAEVLTHDLTPLYGRAPDAQPPHSRPPHGRPPAMPLAQPATP